MKNCNYQNNPFSKIDKFRANADVEWPDRTQEACFAANTHLKKATKATPFRLMFGRDFNPAYLFHASNADMDDYTTSEDEPLIEDETNECIYEPAEDPDEWTEIKDNQRNVDIEVASNNIRQEQTRQKRVYDNKVQQNRYIIRLNLMLNYFLINTN